MEKGIKKFLRTISISPEYLEWGLKYLEQDKDLRGESKRAILNTHKQNLEQALKRLDGLLEMRMNKEVSEEEYAKKKQALEAEKEKHEQVINQFEKVEARANEQTAKVLTFAERALKEYGTGNLKKKREVVATLGSNATLYGRNVLIQAAEPF